MKIILLDVMSLDGKLTRWQGSNTYEWSSPEDAAHFVKVRGENNLLVMGSGTFEVVRPEAEEGRLRVVMTSKPEKYEQFMVRGQIEFTNEEPQVLVKRLEGLGYRQMLLVGGRKTATSFLRKGLLDELWLTVEPKIFGVGEPLVDEEKMDVALRLIDIERLNKQGTVVLKYEVVK